MNNILCQIKKKLKRIFNKIRKLKNKKYMIDGRMIYKAHISNLSYTPQFLKKKLKEYDFSDFDIDTAKSYGKIIFSDENSITYSKWTAPKRTRSYPFARVYNTYHTSGKNITVIPIMKDEGSDTNNDRINYITLSWLNLMNVYIILAWYEDADKKNDTRITNQKLNVDYVNKKIKDIKEYKLDAHHWNNYHFENDFIYVFNNAINSYNRISKSEDVVLHHESTHKKFLSQIIDDCDESKISLEKFKERTIKHSSMAAQRESVTNHALEYLSETTQKGIFHIKNNLGGIYFLTCDEIIHLKDEKTIILQESKNKTNGKFPSEDDIKDGLFKLILFKNIDKLKLNSQKLDFKVKLKLTGNFISKIELPNCNKNILNFCIKNTLNDLEKKIINSLNDEAKKNEIIISIG